MRTCFFFFNDTATTEIYTLSLHDALPICLVFRLAARFKKPGPLLIVEITDAATRFLWLADVAHRSEEHTSELQSLTNLVCRLLLEKKNSISTSRSPRPSRPRSSVPQTLAS